MSTFTVDQLITRAKDAADMHDLFVKPSTWIDWLNVENQALAVMCARQGWPLRNFQMRSFTAPADMTTGSADIPTEILAVVGVWELDSSGRMRRLRCTNGIDGLRQFPGTPAVTGPAYEYWISDFTGSATERTSINFFPFPTSGTYIVVTLNPPTRLAAVTDSLALPMGLEEFLVLKMARRALIKEESDVSSIDTLLTDEKQKIEEFIWNRNLSASPKVRNVDLEERGWGWQSRLTYPPAEEWAWS